MVTMRIYRSCLILLFILYSMLANSSTYHIYNKADFLPTSQWAMVYDTICLENDINLNDENFSTIPAFSGVFNGNGHTIKGVNISSSALKNVGLIDTLKDGSYIHDFKIYGKIQNTRNIRDVRAGLICHVLKNKGKTTIIENIENHVSIYITGSKASVGGIVVCGAGSSQLYIRNCQYLDTIIIKPYRLESSAYGGYYAFNQCGGIMAQILTNDMIENCLYNGHIKVDVQYRAETISEEGYNYDGNIGGIVGYAGKAQKSGNGVSGIKNCLSTGTFDLNGNLFKNEGAIAGIVSSNTTADNNYWVNDTITKGSSSRTENGVTSATDNSTQTTQEEVDNGTVYEELNTNNSSGTWGQYPTTSYEDNNSNYTISYFNFNDDGNSTVFPSNATSIVISHGVYKRAAKYVKGLMSICLPFEVSKSNGTLPAGTIYEYDYATVDETNTVTCVYLKVRANQTTIAAGDAVFFRPAIENVDWVVNFSNESVVKQPTYGLVGNNQHNDRVGVNGSFNTYTIGSGYFKIGSNGESLVYTTASSKCYPYRCYIALPAGYKIPTSSSSAPVRVALNENISTDLNNINISRPIKIIKDGKILIKTNDHIYTVEGLIYE